LLIIDFSLCGVEGQKHAKEGAAKTPMAQISHNIYTVLHLQFQSYGGMSPTQLKNVGDFKKCGGHTFTLQYNVPKIIHLFYIEAF
jgi:hypothetical protein